MRLARRRASRLVLPTAGALRRERRAVRRAREEGLRDLGGLVLEMFRRDRFREQLVRERCVELVSLDARLEELEAMLRAATRRTPARYCSCGAPLPWRSRFCPNCGCPAGEPSVMRCASCGRALPADADFCPRCGAPFTAAGRQDEPELGSATAGPR